MADPLLIRMHPVLVRAIDAHQVDALQIVRACALGEAISRGYPARTRCRHVIEGLPAGFPWLIAELRKDVLCVRRFRFGPDVHFENGPRSARIVLSPYFEETIGTTIPRRSGEWQVGECLEDDLLA